MEKKWPFLIIMWILYGTLSDVFPIFNHDLISIIPVIATICLVFDYYPKKLFNKYSKLEKKLLKRLLNEKIIDVNQQVRLVLNGDSIEDVDVIYNGERICSLKEFESKHSSNYEQLLKKMISSNNVVIDNYEVKDEVKNDLVYNKFIYQIDDYNILIEDNDISNGLYYCSNQLKYLQKLLDEYPDENNKIKKLHDYYLPILLDILENYCKVSKTQDASNLQKKLNQTLVLVNEAIKNITQSLFDKEKINLKADMNVLESLLKKDGVIDGGMNNEQLKAYMEASNE